MDDEFIKDLEKNLIDFSKSIVSRDQVILAIQQIILKHCDLEDHNDSIKNDLRKLIENIENA